MIIIIYQILTEHFKRFERWHSYKANAILNSLEIVFWAAVCFLMIQANIQRCVGTSCALSWVVVVVAIILTIIAAWAAMVTIREFKEYKARMRSSPMAGETRHASIQSTGESPDSVYMGYQPRK